ncbi:hypothetical protein C7293_11780 [filamentous cyanobacterium CCT1]|nr:hypothetical protein C7293_11780 [filamentous cyanobacterium CCT1]PSN77632.1 hypothetical protein C8B47_21080 [filamentous cyanobacterium CCP4]
MELFNRQVWLNFLALLPGTGLTVLTIAVAFLRFYDEQDFRLLELVAQPREWSNRLTVAALLVALVNFGVEWDRRNRETSRFRRAEARAEDERVESLQRRAEDKEQATRRAAIETERDLALLSFLADPSDGNRQRLTQVLAVLNDYRDTLD